MMRWSFEALMNARWPIKDHLGKTIDYSKRGFGKAWFLLPYRSYGAPPSLSFSLAPFIMALLCMVVSSAVLRLNHSYEFVWARLGLLWSFMYLFEFMEECLILLEIQ